MGREVRQVPASWQHPKNDDGRYQPMHDRPFKDDADEWLADCIAWSKGEHAHQEKFPESATEHPYWWTYGGDPPDPAYYMPDWPEAERTHLQMYEDTSEGTPISPVMETPEELAQWLVDNKASSLGNMTATYEQWLSIARGGWAPSAVYSPATGLISGVEAATLLANDAEGGPL